jgi:hypothetical protein
MAEASTFRSGNVISEYRVIPEMFDAILKGKRFFLGPDTMSCADLCVL